jgi:subtilase family serine protease
MIKMFKLSIFLFSLVLFSDAFMSPQEMYSYYNLIPVKNRILNGSTSIAILNAFLPPTLEKDLDLFCSWYNLPPPQIYIHHTNYMSEILKTIHVMDEISMESNTRWYREMNMDVQWAHAMSPGIPIHIVISGGTTLHHMNQALRFIVSSLSVQVVSLSWGVHHTINQYDISLFDTISSLSSAPLFVVSSGDSPQEYWPACSSHVLSIGGTTLLSSEIEMNWSNSGGGTCFMYLNSSRIVPDVGFMASPGILTYQDGKQMSIAGTSIGAPIWTSLIASSPIFQPFFTSSPFTSKSILEWIYSNLSTPYLRYIPSSNLSDIVKHYLNLRPYNKRSGLGVPFQL